MRMRDQSLSPSRHQERTKNKFLAIGCKLIVEKDISKITIDDVLNLSNMSKGTFYNYFFDIEDFLSFTAKSISEEISRNLDAFKDRTTDPAERLSLIICYHILSSAYSAGQIAVINKYFQDKVVFDSPLAVATSDAIVMGLMEGRFGDINFETSQFIIIGAANLAVLYLSQNESSVVSINVARDTCAKILFCLGLARDEARALSDTAVLEVELMLEPASSVKRRFTGPATFTPDAKS